MRQVRAAIYVRISDDREGEGLGVERQREDCLKRCAREGWPVVRIFTDNDISASTKSRKVRPEYREMIKAVERGEITHVVSYSNSRLTRRPLELEDWITLHDRTGVEVRTVVSGDDDLGTADGRMVARIKAAVDAAEAERISERVRRKMAQIRASHRRTGGRAPFGYENAGDGRLVVHPERAAVVKEIARRLLSGESTYAVVASLNARGIRTGPSQRAPEGARWENRTLKRVISTISTIGCIRADDGSLVQIVEPLIDRDDWQRLCEMFAGRSQPAAPNLRKYALSGMMFCSLCGHVLTGSTRKQYGTDEKVQTFQCSPAGGGCGKVRIDYAGVEAWVTDQALYLLDTPAVSSALTPSETDDPGEVDSLRASIARDTATLERLSDDYDDGLLDRSEYLRRRDRITERLAENRATLAETIKPAFTVDTAGGTLRDVWESRDAAWRRTLLEHLISRVEILPLPSGLTVNARRRKGESDQDLADRRRKILDDVLTARVRVHWKV